MKSTRPRAARYSFIARIELTDLESDQQTVEKTMDLSLFGCHVVPGNPSPAGKRLRLQITHNGEVFEALGRVANVRPTTGIGIVFTKIEPHHQLVLEKWLVELRKKGFAENAGSSSRLTARKHRCVLRSVRPVFDYSHDW